MNSVSFPSTTGQRDSALVRTFLLTFAGILTLLTAGCYGPAKGPTNPKSFIVEGRQWTSTDPRATAPDGQAPLTPPGNDNGPTGAVTEPKAQ